jgi:N-acetyl-gamma-glutamyl-phosphate reductase
VTRFTCGHCVFDGETAGEIQRFFCFEIVNKAYEGKTQMIKVGIVGASGYGGGELMRWLALHPSAEVVAATSKTYAGQPVEKAFGSMAKSDLVLSEDDLGAVSDCDIVFLAGADGASMCMAEPLLESGCRVIDLGASFRFNHCAEYTAWYGEEHQAAHLLEQSVYGLPELHRSALKNARLVGNPGCYVTATLLALAPVVEGNLIQPDSIVVSGISGVSGAGRSKFGLDYHFSEMNENAWAYKAGGTHRHTGEIEQELSHLHGDKLTISFTPHIVPMTRGVLATCVAKLADGVTEDQVSSAFAEFYEDEPFVFLSNGLPATKHTLGSNMCHIGFTFDKRTNRVTIVSAIDNLGKGMAGQAIQNMNLMFGLDETTGLRSFALWP